MLGEETCRRYALYVPTHGRRRPGRQRTTYLSYSEAFLGCRKWSEPRCNCLISCRSSAFTVVVFVVQACVHQYIWVSPCDDTLHILGRLWIRLIVENNRWLERGFLSLYVGIHLSQINHNSLSTWDLTHEAISKICAYMLVHSVPCMVSQSRAPNKHPLR